MTTKILIGLAALVAAGFVALFGGAFDSSPSTPSSALAGGAVRPGLQGRLRARRQHAGARRAAPVAAPGRTRRTSTAGCCSGSPTSSARARPATRPTTRSPAALCSRRARSTADDALVDSGLGSLALSRHRFGEALALGEQAHALAPTTARNYGVIGDALVELGRYREAFRAFDTMTACARASPRTRASPTRASCSARRAARSAR